ncbi:MAG: hypothetical protein JSR61_02675 [Proteobacteria bacterium]|nr:hypothetical protein [Pseudomonadota bacterium]
MNYNTRTMLHQAKHSVRIDRPASKHGAGAVRIMQSPQRAAPRDAGPAVYLNETAAKRAALQKQYRDTERSLADAMLWQKYAPDADNEVEIVCLRGRLRGLAKRLNECG